MVRGYGAPFTLKDASVDAKKLALDIQKARERGCEIDEDNKDQQAFVHQHLKIQGAIEMMREHEHAHGKRFTKVVKIRPDVLVRRPIVPGIAPEGVPLFCAAFGGGGGDVLFLMDRWMVRALDSTWKTIARCKLPENGGCRFNILPYANRPNCDTEKKLAPLDRLPLPNHIPPDQFDRHALWPWLWHQGILVSACSLTQDLCFQRPGFIHCEGGHFTPY